MVDVRTMRVLGMHDEHSDHAHHFLHRSMGVIKERSRLMQVEFVDELLAGRNWLLADVRGSVHFEWNLETMPVHGGRFRETIFYDDPHAVALCDLNRGSGTEP